MADLIREGVDAYLASRRGTGEDERIERAIKAAGKFRSGANRVSVEHDRHLAEAFQQ
jgi:hypothetical protein